MPRSRLMLAIGAALLLALPAAAGADTLLFDYVGFDYESPDPNPGTFGEAGSGYIGIGTVPGLFAPLTADTTQFQYTYVVNGMTPVSTTVIGSYTIVDYSVGVLSIYEDSKFTGTGADYGTGTPPNATAPSSFNDGTLFLTGTLNGFQFVFNSATNTGSYNATFTVTGGSQLVNFPVFQRDGWTFAGASGNATNIPGGYLHQVDGQNFLGPVPTRSSSWGQLKTLYR
jgi:hypothetical protein